MLNIFFKNGLNKDPRGRILGSVKNDGHALNACDSWDWFSFMKQVFVYVEIERDVGSECGKKKEEQKVLQNRRDGSI